eukprot:TRINITY_DN5284_c0_g1_i1.p1 TRINITY_DN5284_c0_g1~~TRINITY_DN5284_c0_g1_i1.p1  ORF type:complete len:523 (+),score=198.94 TRINITY_DN5284_c0_g1_i1:163-1731(+)
MEEITGSTTALYGPLIKKPKMTTKLLSKPPFRFLHDVFSELTRNTGFAEGLYQGSELDAGTIKDKESKIAYLQKMLDYTQAACGFQIEIKLGKVVAGLEPENTNSFLQQIAQSATDSRVDRNAALTAVLGGGAPQDDGEAEREAAARAAAEEAARRAEEERHQMEVERMQQQMAEEQEQSRIRQEQEDLMRQQEMQQEQQRAQEEAAMQQQPEPEPAPQQQPAPQPEPEPSQPPARAQQEYAPPAAESGNEMVPPPMRKSIPARPTTARRAPPKIPSKEVKVTNRGPKEPGAEPDPASAGIAVGLITEDDDEDEEDEFVSAANASRVGAGLGGFDERVENVELGDDGMHGKLVGDILEEKKRMERQQQQDPVPQAQEEQPQGIVIKKKRRSSVDTRNGGGSQAAPVKKSSENNVGQLREEIQVLCQAANPLGKCIEYIQEDMENMEKEYRMWKADSQTYSVKLDAQANNTESSLVPLQQELGDQTEKMQTLAAQINRVKASILHNDMTIHNLLRGVVGTSVQ